MSGPRHPDEVEAAVAVAMVAYDWGAYPAPDGGGEPVAEAIEDAVRLALARYIEGPAAPSAQPDEVPCACTTPLPAGSLFYMGSHHQPGCAFYHAPAPAQPVHDDKAES